MYEVVQGSVLKMLIVHDTLKQFYFYSITFSLLKNQGFVKPYSQIKIWNTNTFPRFTLNIEGKNYCGVQPILLLLLCSFYKTSFGIFYLLV